MTRALPLLALAACHATDAPASDPSPEDGLGALSVAPGSLDLGVVFVGMPADAALTVQNIGDGPLALGVAVASDHADTWTWQLTDDAPGPGEAALLALTVTPGGWGDHSAVITIGDVGTGATVEVPVRVLAQEDADGDGVGSLPSGGADCDDDDAAVHRGATEIWYDGIDGDCAGDDDYDQDGDGAGWPDDCDDTDATVGAPAPEAWNGRDDDCDGVIDALDAETAALGRLDGGSPGMGLGARGSLALGGDVDDDGVDDVLVVAADTRGGAAWLVSGADTPGADGAIDGYARASLAGTAAYVLSSVQGPLVDVVGDAGADVAIVGTSASAGAGFVLDGDAATGAVATTRTYTAAFSGDDAGDSARWAVGGDLDGDGVAEMVLGAALDSFTSGWSTAYYTGGVAVFAGGTFAGTYTLADADDRVHGAAAFDYLGSAVAIGDVNGDGYGDVVAGAPGYDGGATNGGAVHVFAGSAGLAWAARAADAATRTVAGTTSAMALGAEALPTPADLDGDTVGDLVIAASAAGRAWVFAGRAAAAGEVAVDDADTTYAGTPGAFATAVAMGDLDRDGTADLAVGAGGDDTVAADAGAVYLFTTQAPGARTAADADAVVYGSAAGDALGSGLAAGGSLDGGGGGTLLVGAPGRDDGARDAGAVYVFGGR